MMCALRLLILALIFKSDLNEIMSQASYERLPTTSASVKDGEYATCASGGAGSAGNVDNPLHEGSGVQMQVSANQTVANKENSGVFSQLKKNFRSLSNSPRELYINFFLKFCESYGYFSLSQILVIYLHDEFGATDMEAGTIYGLWGASIILWGFCASCFNDQLGVRRSLLLGFSMSAISNLVLAFARSKTLVLITLFCLLPIGNCMGMPMLTIGIKRYTSSANRGFAFGLYYAFMNVAALTTGPVVDFFNIAVKSHNGFSGNRMVILTNTFVYLTSLAVTYFFLREIRVQDVDEEDGNESDKQHSTSSTESPLHYHNVARVDDEIAIELIPLAGTLSRDTSEDPPPTLPLTQPPLPQLHHRVISTKEPNLEEHKGIVDSSYERKSFTIQEILYDLIYSPTFWRFVVFTLFLINLRTIFRHVDATLPTYLIRCFGSSYPKGMIYAINPFLIIWLTPTVAAMTSHYPHYDMIKYGGYVSALSPFFVAASTSTWAVVMFMVVLSFGEAIWSPRLYDYTMAIAPEVYTDCVCMCAVYIYVHASVV
ncbi:MFS transporter [archaeon]|nr:MAG: MFS transporter [archaeon]